MTIATVIAVQILGLVCRCRRERRISPVGSIRGYRLLCLLCCVDCGQGRHVHDAADFARPRKDVNWLGCTQKDRADSYPFPCDDLQNVEGDIRRVEIWHDQEIGFSG
jgi:hypothetical protein